MASAAGPGAGRRAAGRPGHAGGLRRLPRVALRVGQRGHGALCAVRRGGARDALADPRQPGGAGAHPARGAAGRLAAGHPRHAAVGEHRGRDGRDVRARLRRQLRRGGRPAARRAGRRGAAALHPAVLPAVRPGVAGLAAGRGDAGRAAARRSRAGAVAGSDAGALHREAGQGRRRARRLPDGARGRLDGPGGGGGPPHRSAAGRGRGRRRTAPVEVPAHGAARLGGPSRPGADDRGGDGPAPAGPHRRPARRRRPPRDRPARCGRPPARRRRRARRGSGVAARRGPRRRRGARHGPTSPPRSPRSAPTGPPRRRTASRRPAAAELARPEPGGVDEVPGGRGPGGRRSAHRSRPHAARGAAGRAVVRPRVHAAAVVAAPARAPDAAVGVLPGRAAAGRRRSPSLGCSRACSTCPTASGCC